MLFRSADAGQGELTAMAQIAAETLGVGIEDVIIADADTDTAPYDAVTHASRGIYVGGGAVKAAAEDAKKSLLPSGVIRITGNFKLGDVVDVTDEEGNIFARGLVNYSREEVLKIKGRKAKEIDSLLGYKRTDELIHRNNLVFLE